MLKVFIGFDPRQPIAYNVSQFSVVKNSSKPVSITPLILDQLPIERAGLTQFTYSRFLVPWLCGYKGKALFMDPDMIVTGDISELFDFADPLSGVVQVRKDQPRFEWSSVMLFNNARCKQLTPEYISDQKNSLFDFSWTKHRAKDIQVGSIPKEWNHCIGYEDEMNGAKLHHYTQGIPCWEETADVQPAPWLDAFKQGNSTVSWVDLMGPSVHAKHVIKRLKERGNSV